MSLVNISIVGNLIKPPEQYIFPTSGKTKTTLVVAVDAPNRKKDHNGRADSDLYRVEAWGKLGDVAHRYLTKGSQVGATGRLVMSHWRDSEGRPRVTPTVEAQQISLPPKPNAGRSISSEGYTNPVSGEETFEELDEQDRAAATGGGTEKSEAAADQPTQPPQQFQAPPAPASPDTTDPMDTGDAQVMQEDTDTWIPMEAIS